MRLAAALLLVSSAALAQPRSPGWEVRVADKVSIAPGETGSISISIAVDRGLTVSKDASVIVDVAAGPALGIRKKRLGRADAVDPEADAPRFAVPVKVDATEATEHAVTLRVRFWVCGGRSCRPVDARRSTVVAVKSAS